MGCARHCVGRLAAAGDTGERQIPRCVSPNHIALLPWDSEKLRADPVYVNHGLRSQIADSRLESDPPIRLNYQ